MLNDFDSIRAKYHRDVMEAVEYGDGDFYVYIHFRGDTGFPFYVGKGSKNGKYDRVNKNDRNSYFRNVANKYGSTAKIIRNCGSDEKLSHDYETELVALFRGIGFDLTNLTDGGEGMSGWVHSDETKRRLTEVNLSNKHALGAIRSEEAKNKLSETRLGGGNTQFKGYVIGYNESNIIILCGAKDMEDRGFNKGAISQCILGNPKYKSCKGYTSWIRTDSPADVYHLLEGREFADEESRVHWEYFDSHYA